ncbi:ribonuclease E/G [Brevundimonas sp. A19_0]|uniref:ribonuclease E/G n=1 Tax=Brevundimonas sp. A19_0 TaxID=2821087 RepID=UPI001ADD48B4|nr:ribonuclease E/G [Brevundimonas sp. A19_0]
MSALQTFLDEAPGETWGVLCQDGEPRRIFLSRDEDHPTNRLEAESIGRVTALLPGGGGAFVDLGAGEPFGFLPKGAMTVGEAVHVAVTAEPRGGKGPTLKRIGDGQGAPRLLNAGPEVADWLTRTAPGVVPETGAAAIEVVREARELALASVIVEGGLDVAVERTRAMVTVDIDHAGEAGRDGMRARLAANRRGMTLAARRITLKNWGGLVAIDLVGTSLPPEPVMAGAKISFQDTGVTFGPLSRFGVLQLSLPWAETPIEEVLFGVSGERRRRTDQIDAVRSLRHALATDRSSPRVTLAVPEGEAGDIAALTTGIGPRGRVVTDPGLAPGTYELREG